MVGNLENSEITGMRRGCANLGLCGILEDLRVAVASGWDGQRRWYRGGHTELYILGICYCANTILVLIRVVSGGGSLRFVKVAFRMKNLH